jgi:hypothetical protein
MGQRDRGRRLCHQRRVAEVPGNRECRGRQLGSAAEVELVERLERESHVEPHRLRRASVPDRLAGAPKPPSRVVRPAEPRLDRGAGGVEARPGRDVVGREQIERVAERLAGAAEVAAAAQGGRQLHEQVAAVGVVVRPIRKQAQRGTEPAR